MGKKKAMFFKKGSTDGKYMSVAIESTPIKISSDYGKTWTESNSPTAGWFSIDISSNGEYQIAGAFGKVYVSYNYGVDWTLEGDVGGTNTYVTVSGDGKYFEAVSYGGKVLRSEDYGQTWSLLGSDANRRGVDLSGDGKYRLSSLYLSQSYLAVDGVTTTLPIGVRRYYRTFISSSGKYMILGTTDIDNSSYLSKDFGVTWFQMNFDPTFKVFGCAISDNGKYIIVSDNSTGILFSNDSGNTFSDISGVVPYTYIVDIDISSNGKYILLFNRGDKEKTLSTDFGVTWNLLPSTPSGSLSSYGGVAISKS